MSEISGFSEIEADWKDSIDEKESCAEINGSKRKVTILHQDAKLAALNLQRLQQGQKAHIPTMKFGGKAEVEIEIKWGDKEGPKYNSSVKFEGHDDKGNYAKVEVNRDSANEGSAKIKAGHIEKRD